jgi:putative tricarboxylic transport membrane protein
MRRSEITGSLFWLMIGLVLTVWSATYPVGYPAQPGSGFLPLGLGILLLIFSTILLVRALRVPEPKAEKTSVRFPRWPSIVLTVAILLAAIFLFERIGYLLTFFLLALVLPLLAGQVTWKGSLLFAVFSVAGIYVIFVWLLKQPLPTGILGL